MMQENRQYAKPLPEILPETAEYWKAAKRHELFLQKCNSCGDFIYFPRIMCPKCMSECLGWVKACGYGTVYSYTVIRHAAHKAFEPDLPYVYAIIDLDEKVRMINNVVNIAPERVRIGMRVKVVFEDATPEISIPRFEPA